MSFSLFSWQTNPIHTQDLPSRPRRNRRSETVRSAVRESILSPSNFILPLFVHDESDKNQPIPSMPGCFRLAYGKNIVDFVAESRSYGINQVVIFPKVRSGMVTLAPLPMGTTYLDAHTPAANS